MIGEARGQVATEWLRSCGSLTYTYNALNQLTSDGSDTYEYDDNGNPIKTNGQTTLAYDGLGSVRQLTDEVGEVLLTQTYDPYGNPYASVGAAITAFGFAGEQTDSSGLVYLRARFYNPAQGRFFQMDPSRQEMNPYRYAMGNPILYTDPSGYCTLGIFGDDCPPENRAALGRLLTFTAEIDFWYPEFWGGFAVEVVNSAAANIPGLTLELFNAAHDIFGGCNSNWQFVPLDQWYGARFQRGRWFGRVVVLALALGEVSIGAAGTGLAIAGTPFTLGGSLLAAIPSVTITAHGAAVISGIVVAEFADPLILRTPAILSAASGGGSSGGGGGGSGRGSGSNRPQVNQMNREIQRGQAPRGIVRVDRAKVMYELDNVHFSNGSSLNVDGTWKHGPEFTLTRAQEEWLLKWGWTLPGS